MSHEHEQPGIEPVERLLVGAAPVPPRIDRDRLMFLAGVASATPGSAGASPSQAPPSHLQRRAWLWPVSTAALAATSLILAMALLVRPAPPERIVYLDRPATNPISPPAPRTPEQPSISVAVARRPEPSDLPANNYVRSRDVALRLGLDALGSHSTSGGDSPAPTYRTWLESFVPPQPNSPGPTPESSQM
jgi:hypothetical protein